MSLPQPLFQDNACEIYTIVVGQLEVNCYLIAEKAGRKCWIVDPGGDSDSIIDLIEQLELHPVAIVNTHGHADHIGANNELRQAFPGLPIWIGSGDAPMLTDAWKNLSAAYGPPIISPPHDRLLEHGEVIQLGDVQFEIRHAPGHTSGEIILSRPGVAIVGDILFAGSVGRTDLPGGNGEVLWQSIKKQLLPLSDNTLVLSGHGPHSTIGTERNSNPFLQHDGEYLRNGPMGW